MGANAQQYTIIKLHNHNDECWGVVDERGALLNFNGLSMRLTRLEAKIIADDRNARAASANGALVFPASYSAADLRRVESALEACASRIGRQADLIERLKRSRLDTTSAENLLRVFVDIAETHERARSEMIDYFHTLPYQAADPILEDIRRKRTADA